ncbi:hypothetical protein ACO2Q8_08480 [Larkinella sp. VNQ87]|uniref:hypothetical protein n=1 Tax=Larkinella sp. VNQ87 TaxID=3400921 RepID=UPI003C0EEC3E
MRYLLPVLLLLLSPALFAQPGGAGLGSFRLGTTTPDSLHTPDFHELETPVVAGTLALPCDQIRLFKADSLRVEGIWLTDLFLVFHDYRLYRITATYSDALRTLFVSQHGLGQRLPERSLSPCSTRPDNRLILTTNHWQFGKDRALAVQARGISARCQPEKTARLTIVRLPIAALTSECDLDFLDPYLDRDAVRQ